VLYDEPAEIEPRTTESGLLSVDQVAQQLGVDSRFVRRLIHERRIAYVKVGRHVRVEPEKLAEWIAANRVRPRTGDRTAS
jgi:excisionase family DNA binding protein